MTILAAVDEELARLLPLPLAQLYRRAQQAERAFQRHQAAFYLWEAGLKLLASAAVVRYVELAEKDNKLTGPLKAVQRATLGQWWELVRGLSRALAEAGDESFIKIRDFLLGRKRDDLPAVARLDAALPRADLGGDSQLENPPHEKQLDRPPRVHLTTFFDRLVKYRNVYIGHGSAGMCSDEFYDRMADLLLKAATELFRKVDVLGGAQLVFAGAVHRTTSGDWSVDYVELTGEQARPLEPLVFGPDEAESLPRPNRVYLAIRQVAQNDRILLRPLHPLLVYDPDTNEAFFPLDVRATRKEAEYFCYSTGKVIRRSEFVIDQQELLARVVEAVAEPRERSGNKAPLSRIWWPFTDFADRYVKPQWRGALLGLLCALACWLLTRLEVVQAVERWTFDNCFLARGPRVSKAKEKIVLVGLDDASISDVGKPLACVSGQLAKVIEYLDQQEVAAIGVDLILRESLAEWLFNNPQERDDALSVGFSAAKAKNVVLAKWYIHEQDGAGGQWALPVWQWRREKVDPEGRSERTDLGFVNMSADPDHFLRRQELYAGEGDELDLHFALALFAVKENCQDRVRRTEDRRLQVGESFVPLDESRQLQINYVGPAGTFKPVSFRRVVACAESSGTPLIDEQGAEVRLKDAVVIIGATSVGAQDQHATPFSNASVATAATGGGTLMSGPEIHANILATLWDEAFIYSWGSYEVLAVLLIAGGLLGYIFSRLALFWGAVVMVAYLVAWKYVCTATFTRFDWQPEILSMLLLGVVCYGATFALRWRRLRRMMGVVKSEAITRALESGAATMDLRGELRVVTVLFADIRDSTAYAHTHTAHEVVELFNTFFGEMVPIIERHGGTLNHYTGDGFMVLFNAPEIQEDHSLRAVEAAMAMVRSVHEQRATWRALDCPQLRIGVGIHRGEAIIGTLGSPRRLDYSAIGDTVNVAALIEAANKAAGSEILISGEVVRHISTKDRRRLGISDERRLTDVPGMPLEIELYRVETTTAARGMSAASATC